MDRHIILMDYLAGFTCLGTACPHICCITDWIIEIDDEHFARLRAAMAAYPADQRTLDTRFPADPGPRLRSTASSPHRVAGSARSCGPTICAACRSSTARICSPSSAGNFPAATCPPPAAC